MVCENTRLAFALHIMSALAWATSHGLSGNSVADVATPPPEKATRCLFKTGLDRESSAEHTPEEVSEGSLAEASGHRVSPAGDTSGESVEEYFSQASMFAEASMRLQQKLMILGKCHSSTGCSVWHGSLDNDAGHYYGWYSAAWGNLLSEYWEARGAAALAGVRYDGTPIPGNKTWLSKLPSQQNAYPALKNMDALRKLCNQCTEGMYPHGCVGKWTRIRQVIRDDTQAALQSFSLEAHVPLPVFHDNDVLVHVRLDPGHPQIAYYAKSFFDEHIPDSTSRIILLSSEPKWGKPILDSYTKMFRELCQHRLHCSVERQSGTQFNDFAAIALAPTVFCSGSTYCLWAAMANRGRVIMSSHQIAEEKMPPIDDFTWVAGHVLPNAEKKTRTDDEWVSYIAKWVQEN